MKTDPSAVERPRRATWMLTLAKLSAIAPFIILANIGVSRFIDTLEIQIWPQHLEIVDRAVLVGRILYVALMATPFLHSPVLITLSKSLPSSIDRFTYTAVSSSFQRGGA